MKIKDIGIDFIARSFDSAIAGIQFYVAAYILVLIFFYMTKKKKMKLYFVYPVILLLLTVYNPYIMNPVAEMISLESRIRRIFWLLPVNIVLAYVITTGIDRSKRWWKSIVLAIAAVILIVLTGTSMYEYMEPVENIYKISDEMIEIVEAIEADADSEEEKKVLYADVNLMELRQYDPSIISTLSRKNLINWNLGSMELDYLQEIIDQKNGKKIISLVIRYGLKIDPGTFAKYVKKYDVKYIIPQNEFELDSYMEGIGYRKILTTDSYTVYRTNQ